MSFLFDLIMKGTVGSIFLAIFAKRIEQKEHRIRLNYKT